MTPIDRLERQLPAAFTDLADEHTPDYFVDILGRTARSRQRPAWAFPGRWFPTMPAITSRPVLTIVAIAVVAILGGAVILSRSDRAVGTPSSPPSASASPGGSPYASPQPLPSALSGGWVAPWRDVAGIAPNPVSTIVFTDSASRPDTPGFALDSTTAQALLFASVSEVAPGMIELVAQRDLDHCQVGDTGRYRWSTDADGSRLSLALVSDPCVARATVVPGSWARSGAYDNHGGTLISSNFEPYFSFVLPTQAFTGWGSEPGVTVSDNSAATFKAWQDPDGFVDYCDETKGRVVLAPGIDAFVQYLATGSGLTVSNQRETTVDGHRAIVVEIGGKPDVPKPCWTNPDTGETGMILQWAQHANPSAKWATEIGGVRWPIVVTEVGGHTIVFEDVASAGGANLLDQSVLDSIRFLDALPS